MSHGRRPRGSENKHMDVLGLSNSSSSQQLGGGGAAGAGAGALLLKLQSSSNYAPRQRSVAFLPNNQGGGGNNLISAEFVKYPWRRGSEVESANMEDQKRHMKLISQLNESLDGTCIGISTGNYGFMNAWMYAYICVYVYN